MAHAFHDSMMITFNGLALLLNQVDILSHWWVLEVQDVILGMLEVQIIHIHLKEESMI